jgi:hypothetical protein
MELVNAAVIFRRDAAHSRPIVYSFNDLLRVAALSTIGVRIFEPSTSQGEHEHAYIT